MQLIAAWYVLQASFFDASFAEEADALLEDDRGYRQLAADTVSNMVSVVEDQNRAKSLLLRFFADPDDGVRKNASKAFSRINPQEAARFDDLIRAYLDSPAFDGDDYSFFEFLKIVQNPVHEYVILAAEKVISHRPQEVGSHWRYRDFHHLNELIKTEYAASENDPDLRRRLLDIIDHFIEYEVYGADEVVAAHDRAA
jgi:hypothetical protein